ERTALATLAQESLHGSQGTELRRADGGASQLDDGPVRGRARYLGAASPEDHRSIRTRDVREALADRGLADPRFTRDREETRFSAGDCFERARPYRELGSPADERVEGLTVAAGLTRAVARGGAPDRNGRHQPATPPLLAP